MGNYDLNDIYKDFFIKKTKDTDKDESSTHDITTDIDIKIDDINKEIDNLYIDDSSKEILKKIIKYIFDYKEDNSKKYITFNIAVNGDNKQEISKIINIIDKVATYCNYVDHKGVNNYSLYKCIDIEDLELLLLSDYGIISIYDLPEFERKETDFKNKALFIFDEQLSNRKITIISGIKDEVDNFLLNDDKLSNKYFKFILNVIDPKPIDVVNDIMNSVNNIVTDKLKIELIDYVTNTLNKRNEDYLTYRDNIIEYISFNEKIPELTLNKTNEEVFSELNELVGLTNVKNKLNELVDLITLKNKTKEELKINDINLHMLFLGNPGTGKTTVARLVSSILYNLKYIRQNKLIEVSSKDLVAEYVGQTAPKTMNVVKKALGGILFIDEAYALENSDGKNSYNAEAIATLIKAMEDYRDDLVVIFAGYTKEMQLFLDSNSGIMSRIGYTFMFDDYTNEELKQIFIGMVKKSGFIIEDSALDKLDNLINDNRNTKNFGNARFVRNVYEKTVLKHASNTKNNKSKKVLRTITSEDITC